MADCGLEMHAEELDRLSWRGEGDARVGEHHDAQSHQDDGHYGFCIHIELQVCLIRLAASQAVRFRK